MKVKEESEKSGLKLNIQKAKIMTSTKGGDTLLNPLKASFKELAYSSIKDTEIKMASLFNKAGCYGAYYYVSKGIK